VTHTDAEQQRCKQLLMQLESGHCDVEGGRARFGKGVPTSTAAEPIIRPNSACARSLLPSMHPSLPHSSWTPSPPLSEHFPPTPIPFSSLAKCECVCLCVLCVYVCMWIELSRVGRQGRGSEGGNIRPPRLTSLPKYITTEVDEYLFPP
jgi:hypothetical protein